MKEFMVLVAVIVICNTNLFAGQCDILVDKLVEKGQLTELEGKDIKTANELLVQAEKNKTDEAIKIIPSL